MLRCHDVSHLIIQVRKGIGSGRGASEHFMTQGQTS
jgi:hypothetical protein